MSWNACGADGNTGNGWTLSGCQGCSISGSGSEDNSGYGLYFTGTCYACTVNGFWCSNKSIALNIDASCYRIVVSGFLEDPLAGAEYSINTATGAIVTLITPQVTTPMNIESGGSYVNQIVDNGITLGGTLKSEVVTASGLSGATSASRYIRSNSLRSSTGKRYIRSRRAMPYRIKPVRSRSAQRCHLPGYMDSGRR